MKKSELTESQKKILQDLPKGTLRCNKIELKEIFIKANKKPKKKVKTLENLFRSFDPLEFRTYKGGTLLLVLRLALYTDLPLTDLLIRTLSKIQFSDKRDEHAETKQLLLSALLLCGATSKEILEIFPRFSQIGIEHVLLSDISFEIKKNGNCLKNFFAVFLEPSSRDRAFELLESTLYDLDLWHRLIVSDLSIETAKYFIATKDFETLDHVLKTNSPIVKRLRSAYPSLTIRTNDLSYDVDDLSEEVFNKVCALEGIIKTCELSTPIHTHRMRIMDNDALLVNFSSFSHLNVPSGLLTKNMRHSMIRHQKSQIQYRFFDPRSAYESFADPNRYTYRIFPLNLKRLSKQIESNPFMISFFQNLFAAFGKERDIFHQLAPYFLTKDRFQISLSMNDCWNYERFEDYLQDKWKIDEELAEIFGSMNYNLADLIASCFPSIKREERAYLLSVPDDLIKAEEIKGNSRKENQKEFLIRAILTISGFRNEVQKDVEEYVSMSLSSKTPILLKLTPYGFRKLLKSFESQE